MNCPKCNKYVLQVGIATKEFHLCEISLDNNDMLEYDFITLVDSIMLDDIEPDFWCEVCGYIAKHLVIHKLKEQS